MLRPAASLVDVLHSRVTAAARDQQRLARMRAAIGANIAANVDPGEQLALALQLLADAGVLAPPVDESCGSCGRQTVARSAGRWCPACRAWSTTRSLVA